MKAQCLQQLTKQKVALFILGAMFLVFPFYYQDNIGGSGLNIPTNATVWMAAVFFIWVSVFRVLKSHQLILPRKILLVLAFPLLATFSGFIAGVSEPIAWSFRLLFIWGGVLFLIGLFQFEFSRSQKDTLLFILVLAGLIHAIVALLQYYQPDGVTIFLPNDKKVATGIFQQINVHASFQATVMLVSWYLINRPSVKVSIAKTVLIFITLSFSTFVVFSSGSRVGAASVIVGFLLLIPICWQVIRRNRVRSISMILIMGITVVAAVYSDGFKRLIDKSEQIHTEHSASERLEIYRITAELIQENPIFGHGVGSFLPVWQYQKADFQQRHPRYELNDNLVGHPHNELMLWQVEGGLLASFGILISFLTIFLIGWRTKARYAIIFLFPLAFHTQVELPFYISATSWFVCLIMIYVALSHTSANKVVANLSKTMRASVQSLSLALMVLSIIFLMHTFVAGRELDDATKFNKETTIGNALLNPYFTKIAEDFQMQEVFRLAHVHEDVDALRYFNAWQSEEIRHRPTFHNFKMLIGSYQTLGDKGNACKAAKMAHHMYQQNEEFRRYVAYCEK